MTFRAGVVLACLGLIALAVVWLRTEKRRSRGTATRLEVRKIELNAESWALRNQVAQVTNPAELARRAERHGIAVNPADEPSVAKSEKRSEPRKAVAPSRRPPAGTMTLRPAPTPRSVLD